MSGEDYVSWPRGVAQHPRIGCHNRFLSSPLTPGRSGRNHEGERERVLKENIINGGKEGRQWVGKMEDRKGQMREMVLFVRER